MTDLPQPLETLTPRKLIPLTDWPQHHSYPPMGGLRHLVFNASANGFDKCIRRVGRRILIDEAAYFEWVDAQNQHSTT